MQLFLFADVLLYVRINSRKCKNLWQTFLGGSQVRNYAMGVVKAATFFEEHNKLEKNSQGQRDAMRKGNKRE